MKWVMDKGDLGEFHLLPNCYSQKCLFDDMTEVSGRPNADGTIVEFWPGRNMLLKIIFIPSMVCCFRIGVLLHIEGFLVSQMPFG